MKAVYLVMHEAKPNLTELACQVVEAFALAKIAVQAEPWIRTQCAQEGVCHLFAEEDGAVDSVVSVGGDGTLLRANQLALEKGVPLLGVNVGRIGFLAELELEQLSAACQRLRRGDYQVESRMMLQTDLDGEEPFIALNDVVISRGGYSRLIAVKAWVDGELVGRYVADGLIVSTPTGSTGYSLSAGGPIVYPDMDCIILSPICAHSLQHRPVVISPRQTVVLELDCDERQMAQMSIDGLEPTLLRGQQQITIKRSSKEARFIRMEKHEFFDLVRHKLTEWSS